MTTNAGVRAALVVAVVAAIVVVLGLFPAGVRVACLIGYPREYEE